MQTSHIALAQGRRRCICALTGSPPPLYFCSRKVSVCYKYEYVNCRDIPNKGGAGAQVHVLRFTASEKSRNPTLTGQGSVVERRSLLSNASCQKTFPTRFCTGQVRTARRRRRRHAWRGVVPPYLVPRCIFSTASELCLSPTARSSGPTRPGKDPKPLLRVVHESGTRDTRSPVRRAPPA